MKPDSIAAGGPRRDWKNLSEMMPPGKPADDAEEAEQQAPVS